MAWATLYERLLADNFETYQASKGNSQARQDLFKDLAAKVKAKAAKHNRDAPEGDLVSVSDFHPNRTTADDRPTENQDMVQQ